MPPRCFIIRHGETEWSLNGRHTGQTDLPLTANGEKRIRATGKALVGNDRLVVPKKLSHIFVSPRSRAQRTLELLELGCRERLPWNEQRDATEAIRTEAEVEVTDAVREWDYGDYEGLTSKQIRELREERGEGVWNIWTDGCPGGESPEDVVRRLDALILDIRNKYQRACFEDPDESKGDVLIVAHGHILRAFAMRWTGKPLTETSLILEAGGIGTLSYEHHNIDEPAIILGGQFVVE
ncbi:unnamed protein product [Penicillium salamii]|uniref:Histidine phosphatase superfamily, clade-1 n=1 Tax=Penicillium salamii TaxID=1612424 RepID=A0A9W4K434_9EURO|nr:unnamed protein product [Penicillium salamii]CAG7954388.1 unnamed protein product [Penicillium salamii]CAG7973433.1 unnamed protein product [Penicillium salamii]CAG8128829.1 unnamed protein product [Penicillium salamii]CAG8137290.1 unnamed protein product [Penicillium salamii]